VGALAGPDLGRPTRFRFGGRHADTLDFKGNLRPARRGVTAGRPAERQGSSSSTAGIAPQRVQGPPTKGKKEGWGARRVYKPGAPTSSNTPRARPGWGGSKRSARRQDKLAIGVDSDQNARGPGTHPNLDGQRVEWRCSTRSAKMLGRGRGRAGSRCRFSAPGDGASHGLRRGLAKRR